MAPFKTEEMDYFSIMGLTPSATEAEIRKAHKKLSLALHPDKNRNVDPTVAAARFSEMQLAYEVLMDPSARLVAAERNKADSARRERRDAYEGKRKAMAEELDKREEEDRQKRSKVVQDERRRAETLQRLREEGRRLREERDKKTRASDHACDNDRASLLQPQRSASPSTALPSQGLSNQSQKQSAPAPDLRPLDLTVKLRFPTDLYAKLSTSEQALHSEEIPASNSLDSALARGLRSRFGALDAVVFRPPKPGKREATALATFRRIEDAHAAVELGRQLKAGGFGEAQVLEDVWIGWSDGEPERVSWLQRHGKLAYPGKTSATKKETNMSSESDILKRVRETAAHGSRQEQRSSLSNESSFPSFSFKSSRTQHSTQSPLDTLNGSGAAFAETDILRRMREAERARLAEQIVKDEKT